MKNNNYNTNNIIKKENNIKEKKILNCKPYKATIVALVLNIYEDHTFNSKKVGMLSHQNEVTICKTYEAADGKKWGKLQSREGWITLEYAYAI